MGQKKKRKFKLRMVHPLLRAEPGPPNVSDYEWPELPKLEVNPGIQLNLFEDEYDRENDFKIRNMDWGQ